MALRRRSRASEAADTFYRTVAEPLLPTDGDLGGLIRNLADLRGKEIVLLQQALPPGSPSGMWVSLAHRDYVVVPHDAPHSRLTAIVCHEVAHIALGHVGSLMMHTSSIAPDIDVEVAARFLGRHGYDAQQERDAERLGTKLAAESAKRARLTTKADFVTDRLR